MIQKIYEKYYLVEHENGFVCKLEWCLWKLEETLLTNHVAFEKITKEEVSWRLFLFEVTLFPIIVYKEDINKYF